MNRRARRAAIVEPSQFTDLAPSKRYITLCLTLASRTIENLRLPSCVRLRPTSVQLGEIDDMG